MSLGWNRNKGSGQKIELKKEEIKDFGDIIDSINDLSEVLGETNGVLENISDTLIEIFEWQKEQAKKQEEKENGKAKDTAS